jgi:hypothetical protein
MVIANVVCWKRARMIRNIFTLSLLLFAFMSYSVHAQQPTKIPRIGFLRASSPSANRTEAFRQRLRGLGYVEGKKHCH